jgi:hypothetical protein
MSAAPDGPDGKPPDPAVVRLLRWYPRAWRERYGDEFLAMVQDSLDGERVRWRLRLGVARAGLRERGHQAALAVKQAAKRLAARGGMVRRGWMSFVAGYVFASLPLDFKASPPPARAWQATAALDAEIAIAVLGGVALLAIGFLSWPAFGRFLRAGGWPEIRRRVARAAGATVVAAGGLAGLVLAPGAKTYDQLNGSWTYMLGIVGAGLLLAAALGLWVSAAASTGRRLRIPARVRAAEKGLAAVTATVAYAMIALNILWLAALQSSVLQLFLGVTGLAVWALWATLAIRRAIRKDRRLRAAAARAR